MSDPDLKIKAHVMKPIIEILFDTVVTKLSTTKFG